MAAANRHTPITKAAWEMASKSGDGVNQGEPGPKHNEIPLASQPRIQTRRKRSRKVRNTMMLPAKMSKAAVCWAVMGTARNPPAIQEHQKRIIALREPRRSFRRYHGATRYQSVFLLPLVTFGTWELGYDAVDFRNRN